ncbi:glycoside hydrolase family 43 protein [Demequina sp. NBRC 110055]|uniref:glycoside hydrolase family 43 protein n=1 Tax=Demequina sp. NBRC 110055 TaxID=1570344 RepID=UPI00190F0096|nr:glycoside hydrolase family 43 protein [Demequina sp. NBRC 110055]
MSDEPYGYLMVHFVEDPHGYREKVHFSLSRGDDPTAWDRLNGGEPILASHLGTTGVRDPYLLHRPDSGRYYLIATDLRVFGADDAGWQAWATDYATTMNVWESDDLIHWGPQRQIDVACGPDGSPAPDAPHMGMMWAPEALWVDDYDEAGGAFVVYWASSGADGRQRILWGATRDFTQAGWVTGGVLIDAPGDVIDTTMIRRGARTYRVTKDNGTARGLFMEHSDDARWWLPEAVWTQTQTHIGAAYSGGDPGLVEGPAMFRVRDEDRWYLLVDVIPDVGYRPMIATDLDAPEPWAYVDDSAFDLARATKHGGVIPLTRSRYDALRAADAAAPVRSHVADAVVAASADRAAVLAALPATAEATLHGGGTAAFAIDWDLDDLDTSVAGEHRVAGVLRGALGSNANDWVAADGSRAWDAPGKAPRSATAIELTASLTVE